MFNYSLFFELFNIFHIIFVFNSFLLYIIIIYLHYIISLYKIGYKYVENRMKLYILDMKER